jgi:hypothetical protein
MTDLPTTKRNSADVQLNSIMLSCDDLAAENKSVKKLTDQFGHFI